MSRSKMFGYGAIGLFVLALVLVPFCVRIIEPGHVGIRVNNLGASRGVENTPTCQGMIFYAPVVTRVFEYPTSVQTAVWTRNPNEGSPLNEELSFNSSEGVNITADVSFSYRLAHDKVPMFYERFRSDDLHKFTHGFLYNSARTIVQDLAAHYKAEDIYGVKKEDVIREAKKELNKELASVGVIVEQFGFIGAPRPPQNIVDALNAKVAASQRALQIENEIQASKAEANKSVAKAEGEARSVQANAEGEATAIKVKAQAQADANISLAKSITPALIEWRRLDLQAQAIAKWNGARPMVEGSSSGLLMQVPLPVATPAPIAQ